METLSLWQRFILISNHSGLGYLFDQPNLNFRQARWLVTLSEFDFEIKYIKGKENRVAGALGRRVKLNHISIVSSSGTYLEEFILHVG